jgi:hypothetical protein
MTIATTVPEVECGRLLMGYQVVFGAILNVEHPFLDYDAPN